MLKKNNRSQANAVFHKMKETGYVGAGLNRRHKVDVSELKNRTVKAKEKAKKKPSRPTATSMRLPAPAPPRPNRSLCPAWATWAV